MSGNKSSKYLRDKSQPKSKYTRTDDARSKYLKTDGEPVETEIRQSGTEKTEYRKNVLTPKRAHELMELEEEYERLSAEALEEEEAERKQAENGAVPEADDETAAPDESLSEDDADGEDEKIFGKKKAYIESSKRKRKMKKLRQAVCLALMTVAAILLQFLNFHVPFTPRLFNVEFSAFPELLAAIAYGPLYGVLVCAVKNLVHVVFIPTSLISDVTNLLLDSVYVFIAGWLYSRSMFKGDKNVKLPKGAKRKGYRRRRIFASATLGALISLLPQFFITRFIAFPLLEMYYKDRGVTMSRLLTQYQATYPGISNYVPAAISRFFPEIKSISGGIIFVNLPVTLAKLFIVSAAASLIYKYISSFLHYRKSKKKSGSQTHK